MRVICAHLPETVLWSGKELVYKGYKKKNDFLEVCLSNYVRFKAAFRIPFQGNHTYQAHLFMCLWCVFTLLRSI